MLGLIPIRFKIYGILAVGLLLGLLGWRNAGIKSALERAEAEETKRRLDQIKISRDIKDEVQALDDNGLRSRASKWVRNDKNDG
ncbi:MAG: hypothetical protein ACPHIB_06925 [Thalassobaculaceae bacterium]